MTERLRSIGRAGAALALASFALAAPARAQDFWTHWGDGKAELNGYRLTQPRQGVPRGGAAVYVFGTEDVSDALRVKADPGRHAKDDVFPVMKLNAIRRFQTGIVDEHVTTSTLLRVARGWPLAKVSFSGQDWSGQVWHQLVPRGTRLSGLFHSYFDGEADGTEDLDLPAGGVLEDALPVLLRGWNGAYLEPGQARTVPLLPTLLRARLEHRRLDWTQARLTRSARTSTVKVPAGTFTVYVYDVEVTGGRKASFAIEARPPFRLVRQTGADGEDLELLGSARLAYWTLSQPGGEKYLEELGLRPEALP
ncbi:MAG TPA: hypothetical protein VMX54_08335 [Vicinamibacteria bacterium]|nr:hypothetical protein [Vicinamibacteria bacterium]